MYYIKCSYQNITKIRKRKIITGCQKPWVGEEIDFKGTRGSFLQVIEISYIATVVVLIRLYAFI